MRNWQQLPNQLEKKRKERKERKGEGEKGRKKEGEGKKKRTKKSTGPSPCPPTHIIKEIQHLFQKDL